MQANAWRVLLIGLGSAVVPLDTSVNVAFPAITERFAIGIDQIQWVVIAYVLTYGSLMLAFGRLGDMFGHALIFRIGLAWSTLALLLCAAAPDWPLFLLGRAMQGVGAALVLSCGPALMTALYPEAMRARMLGAYAGMAALAGGLGPLLGGVLVQWGGWNAVFWFRAPIALIALLALRGLPSGPPRHRERFDILGAALLIVALVSLLFLVNRARALIAGDSAALGLALVALASTVAFIRHEARLENPIVDLSHFRKPGFALLNLANTLVHLAGFSVLLLVPYFLAGQGRSASESGVLLACAPLGMMLASPVGARLAERMAPAPIVIAGALLSATGLGLVAAWTLGSGSLTIALALALQGIGVGLFQVAYLDTVAATLPRAARGVAGSLGMLTRTIGVVSAASVLSLLFEAFGGREPAAFDRAFSATFLVAGGLAGAVGLVGLAAQLRRRR